MWHGRYTTNESCSSQLCDAGAKAAAQRASAPLAITRLMLKFCSQCEILRRAGGHSVVPVRTGGVLQVQVLYVCLFVILRVGPLLPRLRYCTHVRAPSAALHVWDRALLLMPTSRARPRGLVLCWARVAVWVDDVRVSVCTVRPAPGVCRCAASCRAVPALRGLPRVP